MSGDPDVLEYYKNDHSKKPLRIINLNFCEQVDAGLTFNRKELQDSFVFDIKTSERTFYLVAETEEDMNKWVQSICQICGFNQAEESTGRRPFSAGARCLLPGAGPAAKATAFRLLGRAERASAKGCPLRWRSRRRVRVRRGWPQSRAPPSPEAAHVESRHVRVMRKLKVLEVSLQAPPRHAVPQVCPLSLSCLALCSWLACQPHMGQLAPCSLL